MLTVGHMLHWQLRWSQKPQRDVRFVVLPVEKYSTDAQDVMFIVDFKVICYPVFHDVEDGFPQMRSNTNFQ